MSRAITVRIDENVKQQAEDMLSEIGLNMTTYINSSLRALVREKRVPFELTTKQHVNAEYLSKLDESIAQAERGEVVLIEASQTYKKQVMDYRQEFIDIDEREINGSSGLLEYDNYDDWLQQTMVEKEIECSKADTSATVYFLFRKDDNKIIGSIKLRHHLTEELLKDGGNIGYGIRPSERGKGYGTMMLSLVLEKAKKLGLNKVMISCNKDNRASAHVAIRNGGVLAGEGFDKDEGKITEIYWIDIV